MKLMPRVAISKKVTKEDCNQELMFSNTLAWIGIEPTTEESYYDLKWA